MARTLGFAVALLLLAACGGSQDETQSHGKPPPCATCNLPVEPPATCPAGQAPLPSGCAQVGPSTCATGFVAHSSGYGCVPVLPQGACTGATKATLGSESCTPVGDCNAAFPPADATVFVDASGMGPPHYAIVEEAIVKAPAGAVIAIDDGTYDEALAITHPVTLVGRCPERVVIAPSSSSSPVLNTNAVVSVRGLTLRGGAGVTTFGTLSLEDVVVEQGAGRAVRDGGAHVTITRSVLRDVGVGPLGYGQALYTEKGGVIDVSDSEITGVIGRGGVAFDPGSQIALDRSVVHAISVAPDGSLGGALTAYQGAELSLVESATEDTHFTSLALEQSAKGAVVQRSTLSGVAKAPGMDVGIAIDAGDGASVDLEDATLTDIATTGLSLIDPNTSAVVNHTAFVGIKPGGPVGFGAAMIVQNAAAAHIDASVFVDASGIALQAADASTRIDLHGSYIGHTAFGAKNDGGFAAGITHGAAMSIDASTIEDSGEVGVFTRDEGSSLTFSASLLRGVHPDASGKFGIGLFVASSSSATISNAIVRDAASVGVFASHAGGRVTESVLEKNAIGVHAQDGSTVIVIGSDGAPLDPLALGIAASVRFEDNGARTDSSVLPLPPVPLP